MRFLSGFLTLVAAVLMAASATQSAHADVLYIGEGGVGVDTVKRFDATTGSWIPGSLPAACSGRGEWWWTAAACSSSTRT